jgi:hypothetical protein
MRLRVPTTAVIKTQATALSLGSGHFSICHAWEYIRVAALLLLSCEFQ